MLFLNVLDKRTWKKPISSCATGKRKNKRKHITPQQHLTSRPDQNIFLIRMKKENEHKKKKKL